jgi:amino acid transporter
MVTAAGLFVVTYIGAGWALRVQYGIMVVLGASIVVFLAGSALRFSPDTFVGNVMPAFSAITPDEPAQGVFTFWMVFAIYFPAVTGIMAGINMSGDLKEPAKSLPRGTLAAIGVGLVIYLAQILISGGAFTRERLMDEPYLALKENALFHLGFLVAAGMFAATLSSGLSSFMGAPRVLQAVARDGILATLRPFATGSRGKDEPRRGIVLCGLMTFGVIYWATTVAGDGALNMVAQIITQFFLYTYGMLNIAAFIEGFSGNPSFRPRFRFFHWSTALLGGIGCAGVALVINPWQAVAAVVFLGALVWRIKRRELDTAFGDARRGFVYRSARNNLLQLSEMEESPRNWRPTTVVFSGNPEHREALVSFAVWMEAGRGVVFLANVLVGNFEEIAVHRRTAAQQLREFCRKRSIDAFPVVVIDENLENGMTGVMQTLSMGPLRTNMAVFGWSEEPSRVKTHLREFCRAKGLGMSVVVIHEGRILFPRGRKRIDIWWRGLKNGGLMVILAHLLTRNWEWARTDIRLLRQIENEAGRESTREDLQRLLNEARMEAEVEIVVSAGPFGEVLREQSSDADCVFLGFEVPPVGHEGAWFHQYEDMMLERPTTILVSSIGDEDLMA